MSLVAEFHFFPRASLSRTSILFQPFPTEVKESLASSEVWLHLVQ